MLYQSRWARKIRASVQHWHTLISLLPRRYPVQFSQSGTTFQGQFWQVFGIGSQKTNESAYNDMLQRKFYRSELTPSTIHKHIDIVSQQLKMKAVFVHSSISSFRGGSLNEMSSFCSFSAGPAPSTYSGNTKSGFLGP